MFTVLTDLAPLVSVSVNVSGTPEGTNVDEVSLTRNCLFPLPSVVKYRDCGFNPDEFDKVEPIEFTIV
jgi:hypothetical protein